ncbi:MAG: L-seryl-tRNA(Sec) selenium transferase [Myxococcota bacterium]|nr:L-seryl-tRNA(Sec) selenium transferase [Myxococcota bacterium]
MALDNPLKRLPSVEVLLGHEIIKGLVSTAGRSVVLKAVRAVLDEVRNRYQSGDLTEFPDASDIEGWLCAQVHDYINKRYSSSLKPAINATGVVLHTGLGRAVLTPAATQAAQAVMETYCTLAIDPETGRRGHRDSHLNDLICELTGAEAATVVGNNAAATMLVLNTLAKDRQVIVSRGQLVEIGGSFRMPEVMETSSAELKDVGTTNKTHLWDYERAICEETGAIMRVHHSNYRILGFSSEPSLAELTDLAHQHGLPIIDDIGSGALVDLSQYGVEREPLVRDSIQLGVDVVCFSGDKLIGGPQAGIIIGKAEIVKRIRKNPLARAFRVGKMTIAALEATLKLFLDPARLAKTHPVYRMFAATPGQLSRRARRVLNALKPTVMPEVTLAIVNGHSQIGSGSVPVETLPSKLLSIKTTRPSAGEVARRLRYSNPAIFARVHKDAVLLDFRTIAPGEDQWVRAALNRILGAKSPR